MRHDKREKSSVFRLPWDVATIHKDIFTPAMAMEVAEDLKFTLLGKLEAKLFRRIDCWMKYLTRSLPPPIKITSGK